MSWNELSLKDKADYIKESVNNGIYNLSDIRNRYNMYANGGYKPSESIKKRITNWEGSSMRTNRSFQAEADDFNKVIPSSIRSKLSQQQLDALYSYGYNVGMGNLKKRVLPTLINYVQGKASNEDVQKSMWASKDNELRGLTTRRNIERSLFGGNYQTVFTGTGGTPHNYGYIAANTNRSSSNPYQIQNEEWQGKNYLDAYKGLQLSINDIMDKTKEDDIDDLFSTGTGPTISMENLLSIGNNTVAPVQPDYSYAKSLLSDFDSDLNSNIFGNGGKRPKTYQGDLSHLKDVSYQKWRANLPTNLREETSDYNLYEAYKSGAKPRLESNGYYHLPSRDPRTNKILKKPTHPTYGMALREDAIEGYLPMYKNGETYTYLLPWIKADGGKLNIFAEGGNKDNNRTAMPAHPTTNPYKRRSWETDEEYKERIQDLDNKSQEVALNDSTAINKYKEWEANIQKQQKINKEKSKAITIEKNTKRAKTLEKEFNSLRNISSQMSPNDTIQVINKNIPEAYKQQYINNINMYKPALDTIDLGINLYSLYNPTVPVLSAGLLTNGLQFGQYIVDENLEATDYSALAFDTLGLLGATNKLPTRLRIGKNIFWNIDKTADYLGAGQNILDSASDIYDLSKTGYYLYNNKGSNNLYISPFKKSFDEGGNLSYIDADNRRSNILLHIEDGNLYDSAGNNYTQSYLDEEHVPIIKGTMPRNTRQYYDPNTTLEFINAATAPISNFIPSNIVGSIREARDYNTFMNSFMNQDNTGFFTREYAKEHPYISTLGNIVGDILIGTPLNKEYNTFKNSINNRISKSISNEASDIYGKELSDKLKEGYFNFTKGKEIPITLNENSFRSAKQIPLVMEEGNEFKNFPIGEYTSKRVKDYYKDVMTPLMAKQGIIAPEKLKSAVLTVPENPTDWNGFYNYYTGIPYLKVKAKNGNLLTAIKNGDFNSTYLHEAASHGTDKQVLNNFLRDFYDFNTFLPKDYNWNPIIKASRDKEEFRATMNQVRDKILDSYYIINGKYPKGKDLEKAVDDRDMNLIMNMFYTTNAYGKDYYNAYQDLLKRGNKQDLINFENEIRRSLKYFPAIGAGITLINNSKVK